MIEYIEFLNLPATIAIVTVVLFLILQIIGELLEFKGKIVPEFLKIRKYFNRKKTEREMINDAFITLKDVKTAFAEFNTHYNSDNIRMRDQWIKSVNKKLEQNDIWVKELDKKLDKNNQDTLSLLIDSKRNTIINFASFVIDEKKPVTREQYNRIFKIYEEYENIILNNKLTNGEVDIAIRIIKESYEKHMKHQSFVEDVLGYNG